MFELYTEKAKRVIFFARLEAGEMGAVEIGAEHLLLGLFREDQPLLERITGTPMDIEAVRRQISGRAGTGEAVLPSADMPLNTSAKLVLESTAEESKRLRHMHVGTEHLLLGLLRQEASVTAEILCRVGLSLKQVREDLAARPPGA